MNVERLSTHLSDARLRPLRLRPDHARFYFEWARLGAPFALQATEFGGKRLVERLTVHVLREQRFAAMPEGLAEAHRQVFDVLDQNALEEAGQALEG